MNHWYVSRDWFIRVTWLVLTPPKSCHADEGCDSFMWHDSFVTRQAHMVDSRVYAMTHWYVSVLPNLFDMTHSSVWHDPLFAWHDPFICVTWLICMCPMPHVTRQSRIILFLNLVFCAHVCTPWLICMCPYCRNCVMWHIHLCDMTQSCMWHDSFVCVTCRTTLVKPVCVSHMCMPWLIDVCQCCLICVTWFTHLRDMTHSSVCHDARHSSRHSSRHMQMHVTHAYAVTNL